jgi:hypothetical protein
MAKPSFPNRRSSEPDHELVDARSRPDVRNLCKADIDARMYFGLIFVQLVCQPPWGFIS